MTKQNSFNSPKFYRIKLKGRLDQKWSDWFEGMRISYKGGNTILSGSIVDQAALHGLLTRIRDLNFTLLSVEQTEENHKK